MKLEERPTPLTERAMKRILLAVTVLAIATLLSGCGCIYGNSLFQYY